MGHKAQEEQLKQVFTPATLCTQGALSWADKKVLFVQSSFPHSNTVSVSLQTRPARQVLCTMRIGRLKSQARKDAQELQCQQ